MFRYVVMTCKMYICDMFYEIPIMASRGPVKSLIKCLHQYLCFDVIYHFSKFHEVLRSGLSLGTEKWHKIRVIGSQLAEKSLACPYCGSD